MGLLGDLLGLGSTQDRAGDKAASRDHKKKSGQSPDSSDDWDSAEWDAKADMIDEGWGQ